MEQGQENSPAFSTGELQLKDLPATCPQPPEQYPQQAHTYPPNNIAPTVVQIIEAQPRGNNKSLAVLNVFSLFLTN